METLTSTYKDKITGTLSCFDRIIITGTVPQICYAQGMTSYLYSHNIRIFDYAKFAEPLKEQIRSNAEGIAKENDIEIEFVRKSHIRKEDLTLVLTILRGEFNISGFRNKDIRMRMPQFNTGKVSRLIKRLKVFKLIKKLTL